MKFFHKTPGIHWDAENNKLLAFFKAGVADVTEESEIFRLLDLGYEHEEVTDMDKDLQKKYDEWKKQHDASKKEKAAAHKKEQEEITKKMAEKVAAEAKAKAEKGAAANDGAAKA